MSATPAPRLATRVVAVAAVLFLLGAIATLPARAQNTPSPAARAPARPERLGGPERQLRLRVAVDGAPQAHSWRYRCIARSAVARRSPRASTARTSAPPFGRLPPVLPVDSLPRAADGSIQLTFPVSTSNPPPLGIRVDGQGVFPVLVSLLDANDNELDRFVTHLVRLPAGRHRVTTARVLADRSLLRVARVPTRRPSPRIRSRRRPARGAARSLASNPTVPLVLDPVAETVESLYNSGEGGTALVSSLSRSLTGRQVLGRHVRPPRSGIVGRVHRSHCGRRAHPPDDHRKRRPQCAPRRPPRSPHHGRRPNRHARGPHEVGSDRCGPARDPREPTGPFVRAGRSGHLHATLRGREQRGPHDARRDGRLGSGRPSHRDRRPGTQRPSRHRRSRRVVLRPTEHGTGRRARGSRATSTSRRRPTTRCCRRSPGRASTPVTRPAVTRSSRR